MGIKVALAHCSYTCSYPFGAHDNVCSSVEGLQVEAESRRGRRFEASGFTPGAVDMPNGRLRTVLR